MEKKQKNLTETIGFWTILTLGMLIEVGLIIFIHRDNDLTFCFTQKCIETFNSIFSVTGTVATGTIALLAFYATIFRSKQTQTQIEISMEQNKAKNYYDHKKDFKEWLSNIAEEKLIKIHNLENLYSLTYPKNDIKNVDFYDENIIKFADKIKDLHGRIKNISKIDKVQQRAYEEESIFENFKEIAVELGFEIENGLFHTMEPSPNSIDYMKRKVWDIAFILQLIITRNRIKNYLILPYQFDPRSFERYFQ